MVILFVQVTRLMGHVKTTRNTLLPVRIGSARGFVQETSWLPMSTVRNRAGNAPQAAEVAVQSTC